MPPHLLLVAGARPNFMKVAPLIRTIRERISEGAALSYKLVHTGQHYDDRMSAVFFSELGIPAPDVNLNVGSGSHARQTADTMVKFEAVCEAERPDWVVVFGDINSTIACSLVSAKLGVPVAHVEAGLRSFDRSMPEEINRLVTDALADLLLTPSPDADANLAREGVPATKIALVGNIMIDSLVANLDQARASALPEQLGIAGNDFAYVTLHRPATVDDPARLAATMTELQRLAQHMSVVFPMHPRTRKMCADGGVSTAGSGGLQIIEPIGYHDSLCLTESARLVLTDSGGLQEESTWFHTPCLTLRPNTERPITITLGSNRLTTIESLSRDIDTVLAREPRFGSTPPLWDGHTAGRIVDRLLGG